MNKDKIMHLVTLMSATDDEQQQEDIFEAIEIELYSDEKYKVAGKKPNSKIVMPKVFDDWYKRAVQLKKEHPDEDIDFFYGLANVYLDPFNAEKSWKDIAGWLHGDIDKYLKCIDAIRYGYEVEK